MNALDATEDHSVWEEDKASEADVESGCGEATTSVLAAVTWTRTVPLGYITTKRGMVKLGGSWPQRIKICALCLRGPCSFVTKVSAAWKCLGSCKSYLSAFIPLKIFFTA